MRLWNTGIARFLVMAILLLSCTAMASAAPLQYDGSLELRTPLWASQDRVVSSSYPSTESLQRENFRPSLRFLDFGGSLRLSQAGSPLSLWVTGEHSFSSGYFVHENKLKVGLDLKLGKGPVTLFSYWDRRFDKEDLDRVFLGVRCGFRGQLD